MRKTILRIALTLASFGAVTGLQAQDMRFRVVGSDDCGPDCSRYVLASGRITPTSYNEFMEATANLPRGTPIHLNSPGGTLVGGMMLGLAFRERQASVFVARGSICASACAYAFLGGVRRQVPSGSRLGVHRFYAPAGGFSSLTRGEQQALTQHASMALRGYISAMGVKPELAALAARIDPTNIHYLSGSELRSYRVITGAGTARASATRNAPAARSVPRGRRIVARK